jgi:uncharacterized protein YkwD
VRAAPLNAANYDRLLGCAASTARNSPLRTPLYYSAQLSSAAKLLAGGSSLQHAMSASGYVGESTELHLSGVTSDADIQRVLAAHYCHVLTDTRFKEFGVEQRGKDVWMLLAAPAPVPKLADTADISRRILDMVNAARAAGRRCGAKNFAPAGPLALDPALARAALAHSREMASHDEFDHRGHDGSTPAQRVEQAGFGEHRIVGENIAAGAMTPDEVTRGWLASPAHCENIMDGRFTLIGIAFAENLHTAAGVFWTQDFAAHR